MKQVTGHLTARQIIFMVIAESRGVARRFIFFVLCIAIGVGAVMTIKSFSNLLTNAISAESKGLLAADLEIKGSWAQSEEDIITQKKVLPEGTDFIFIKELHGMAIYKDESNDKNSSSLLVELKAIPFTKPNYPLYGEFEAKPDRPLESLIADNGAVVEPSFLLKTGLKVGDPFSLGKSTVILRGTVIAEPDRISRAFSIGPRVFISRKTLDEAQLMQVGSRVKHRTLIRIPDSIELEKAYALLQRGLKDKSITIRHYKDMQSSLTDAIERMGQYLGAVGVIALILGGIGVAMIIRTFMAQKLDTIAIMNCLGASSRTIFKVYLLQALLLGFIGSVLGVALGFALQYQLPDKLVGLLNIQVQPGFYWVPALQSMTLGMVTTLLFCLWPLIRAVKTRPLRLFRRNFEDEELTKGTRLERWSSGFFILAGLSGMVMWQAESFKRGALFLAALGISALVLGAVSILLLKLIRKMPAPKSMTRRYGLANLHRPNSQATSIITCLGMGLMLVLTIRLVQMDMLAMFDSNTKGNPPNYFFIDIQVDQKEKFVIALDSVAPEAEREIMPLIRSKFYSVDGRKAESWQYKNQRNEEWFINRSFVLTHSEGPPPRGNTVIKGKWWTKEEASIPQVSLEEDAAKRMGVGIGSELVMDIQGIKVSAPITSIRKVDWRNMRTNFYMIFSPGALEGAPITYVATVNVPDEKEQQVQNAVVKALPNVTALSTKDIINTVQAVTNKLKTLVDFMSAFSISAGLFILAGSVASTKFRRLKESAVLKILGAKRSRIAGILGVEYVTLGIVAGVMGVGLSMALSWAVMKYLIKADWHAYPQAMLWTLALTILLTTLTGILSSLDVLRDKPFKTLRKLEG